MAAQGQHALRLQSVVPFLFFTITLLPLSLSLSLSLSLFLTPSHSSNERQHLFKIWAHHSNAILAVNGTFNVHLPLSLAVLLSIQLSLLEASSLLHLCFSWRSLLYQHRVVSPSQDVNRWLFSFWLRRFCQLLSSRRCGHPFLFGRPSMFELFC